MARACCRSEEIKDPARESSVHRGGLTAFLSGTRCSCTLYPQGCPHPIIFLVFRVTSAKSEVWCEKIKCVFVGGTEGLLGFRDKCRQMLIRYSWLGV